MTLRLEKDIILSDTFTAPVPFLQPFDPIIGHGWKTVHGGCVKILSNTGAYFMSDNGDAV